MAGAERSVVWSTLEVKFYAFPAYTIDDVSNVTDGLIAHYWQRPRWIRRFVEPLLSGPACDGHELSVQVSGFPPWMPAWWARRVVVRCALREAVDGWATSHRVTNSLLNY